MTANRIGRRSTSRRPWSRCSPAACATRTRSSDRASRRRARRGSARSTRTRPPRASPGRTGVTPMRRLNASACSRSRFRAGDPGLPDPLPQRRARVGAGGPVPVLADPRRTRPPPDRRGNPLAALARSRCASYRAPGRLRHRLQRLGAERARRERGERRQLLGRAHLADADARRLGGVGAVLPRSRRRRSLQVPGHPRRRHAHLQGRSAGPGVGPSAGHREHRRAEPAPLARRAVDAHARGARADQPGTVRRLRGAPRLLAAWPRRPGAQLSRDRRAARRALPGDGIHARRAAADHGASLSAARGATRSPATTHRPHGMARRTTFARSSTSCIATASA